MRRAAGSWLTAVALAVLGAGTASAGGLEPPPPVDRPAVEHFCAVYPDAGSVLLQQWLGVDVRYRAKDGGLSGKVVQVVEYVIRKSGDLEDLSRVVVRDNPRERLKSFTVEVDHGDKRDRYDRGDLVWRRMTEQGGGVVTLDGSVESAMIPRVTVGDRVRLVQEHALTGTFGISPAMLGQTGDPYLRTELALRVPADYTVVWGSVGRDAGRENLGFAEEDDGGSRIYRWWLAADADGALPECDGDFPACRVVPHVARAGGDQAADVAVGADWATVGQAYLDRIAGVCDPDDGVRALAAELIGDATEPLEKIDRLYLGVQRRYRYLGLFEGAGALIPERACDVLAAGYGDCKGLGTLLIALLRAGGFDAHPVLVRTGSAGLLDPDIPDMAQFNHYIAWVDTGDGGIFLDGTVDACPAGLVPLADGASPVLLLRPGAIGMTRIPAAACDPGTADLDLAGRLREDGRLDLTCTLSVTGNFALGARRALTGLAGKDRDETLRRILRPEGLAVEPGTVSVTGLDAWRAPLVLTLETRSRTPLPSDDRAVFLPRRLGGTMLDFDLAVPCGAALDLRRLVGGSERWSIQLPAGLALGRPDSLALDRDGVAWSSRVRQDGSTLELARELRYADAELTAAQASGLLDEVAVLRKADAGYIELRRP